MADTRPFEGVRVIDVTHVLAGPFATYQLAVHGADVIKVENPRDPDMARVFGQGVDNAQLMATNYLTQGSNKRCITLDLKTPQGQAVLKKLVATADVFAENYRSGAMDALGLGYDDLIKINPRLIYASFSAFGADGPRGRYTGYEHIAQASSGLLATNGEKGGLPMIVGSPVADYSSGTMGAFALATALFQREKTGKGQRIDMAMTDVCMMLMGSYITEFTRNGNHPEQAGNWKFYATVSVWPTKDGSLVVLGAGSVQQQRDFWNAVGMPEMIKESHAARFADAERETKVVRELMLTRTAEEWEIFLQQHHVPAARVRRLEEALADPHMQYRAATHHLENVPGVGGAFDVPVAAFKLAHGGARIDTPPPRVGQDTDSVLKEFGYSAGDIARLRSEGVV